MPNQEYQVKVTAETKQATDKIDAVQNSLDNLTKNDYNLKVNVDSSALRSSAERTQEIANNIKATAKNAQEAGGIPIVSALSVQNAASLAGHFYSIRKDTKGLGDDFAKGLKATNISEFLRTEKFLDRVSSKASSRSKEIIESYNNIRELPGTAQLLAPVENFARVKAWDQFGSKVAEQTVIGVKQGIQKGIHETKEFLYGDILKDIVSGANSTIDTLARVGLAIQGVQLLLSPLQAAWNALFDQVIGQNVRLEQTILSTQTTLASTARIINTTTGNEIRDPLDKINTLEASVRKAVDNIRVRSLDLAGVTSQQIIDIFGVVATSISQVGGDIKDAEDLAISFTAALGTLGIPFYQARQEIGSILGGYITEDSLLAKRLQISNQDIAKARQSIDGITGYLQKKLQIAVAGQAISAKGFTGVLSNIQEIIENVGQKVGAPLLQPIIGGLTAIYNFLKDIQGVLTEVGGFLSKLFADTLTGILRVVQKTQLVQGIKGSIDKIAEPYRNLGRAVELGLRGSNINLLTAWMTGIEKVPQSLKGVVSALVQLSNFIKLQFSLIIKPVTDLIDQSRTFADGATGVIQRVARSTQVIFGVEAIDAFTQGWDTVVSTVQAAASAIIKFGSAFIKLKIVEFTAQLRAAATIVQLFGSELLGKLNLAISFFDFLGNIASSDLAKFIISLTTINSLLSKTEFFGFKNFINLIVLGIPGIKKFVEDIKLFYKGFKDAGNIEKQLKDVAAASQKLVDIRQRTNDPVLKNALAIRSLNKELDQLRLAQKEAFASTQQGTDIAKNLKLVEDYQTKIVEVEAALAKAKKTQDSFSATAKIKSSVTSLFENSAEAQQARQALRETQVIASGAATAQALSSALTTLGERLGLTKEQMKGLGGAAAVAGRSLKAFLTTTALINIGFAALSIGISSYIAYIQGVEERETKRRTEALKTADVNRILASSYTELHRAAAGGDIAAQRRIQEDQDAANDAYQIQSERKKKLLDERLKLEETLKNARSNERSLKNFSRYLNNNLAGSLLIAGPEALQSQYVLQGKNAETLTSAQQRQLQIRKEIVQVDKKLFDIAVAQQKLEQEKNVRQDFTILSERRKEIEEKIKLAREDFNKEITDKEFQTRMELLSLEQQKRREIQQQEIKALEQRFSLLAENATDQDAKIINLVKDYESALLQATNAEANRRAELAQKEKQLSKEVADYSFKMARERVNLEKQVGSYQKEVESWKNKQQRLRFQEELVHERSVQALKGIYFKPYNVEQQQAFINGFNGRNIAYAHSVLSLVPKASLGITGDEQGSTIINKLLAYLDNRKATGQSNKLKDIAGQYYTPSQVAQLLPALADEAKRLYNLQRFYQPRQDAKDLQTPDLRIDYAGMQSRLEQANASVLDAQRSLNDAIRANDKSNAETALGQLKNPAIFGPIKDSYTSELNTTLNELSLAVDSASSVIGQSAITLKSDFATLKTVFTNSVGALLRAETKIPQNDINKYLASIKNPFLTNSDITRLGSNKYLSGQNTDNLFRMLYALNEGASAYRQRTRDTLRDRQQIDEAQQLKKIINNIESQRIDAYSASIAESFSKLDEAIKLNTKTSYSLQRAEQEARNKTITFISGQLASLKGDFTKEKLQGVFQAAKAMQDQLLKQAKALDPFMRALETYTLKIQQAQQATELTAGGLRTALLDIVVGGKSVSEALRSFAESVNKGFAEMLADFVMKPIKEKIFDFFKGLLKIPSAEDQLKQAQLDAVNSLQSAGDKLTAAGIKLSDVADALGTGVSVNPIDKPNTNTSTLSEISPFNAQSFVATTDMFNKSLSNANSNFAYTNIKVDDFSKYLSKASFNLDGISTSSSTAGSKLTAFAGTLTDSIGSAIRGAGSKSNNWLVSLLGFGLQTLPIKGKAIGGSITAGHPYLVGERGPELIIPGSSGTVIPNHALGGAATNVVVNVDARGSSVQGNDQRGEELGRALSAAVQAELIKQKRPGGLLAT